MGLILYFRRFLDKNYDRTALSDGELKKRILRLFRRFLSINRDKILGDPRRPDMRNTNVLLLYALQEQMSRMNVQFRNPDALSILLHDSFNKTYEVFQEQMKETEKNMFRDLQGYFANIDFLKFLLLNPKIENDRMIIGQEIRKQFFSDCLQCFALNNLKMRRKQLAYLLNEPNLLKFLTNDITSSLVMTWLVDVHPSSYHAIRFHIAVEDFKSIVNRKLLRIRAHYIWREYLDECAECQLSLSPDIVQDIQNTLETSSVTRSLFARAQQEIMIPLMNLFEDQFNTSEEMATLQEESCKIDQVLEVFSLKFDDDDEVAALGLKGKGSHDVLLDRQHDSNDGYDDDKDDEEGEDEEDVIDEDGDGDGDGGDGTLEENGESSPMKKKWDHLRRSIYSRLSFWS